MSNRRLVRSTSASQRRCCKHLRPSGSSIRQLSRPALQRSSTRSLTRRRPSVRERGLSRNCTRNHPRPPKMQLKRTGRSLATGRVSSGTICQCLTVLVFSPGKPLVLCSLCMFSSLSSNIAALTRTLEVAADRVQAETGLAITILAGGWSPLEDSVTSWS